MTDRFHQLYPVVEGVHSLLTPGLLHVPAAPGRHPGRPVAVPRPALLHHQLCGVCVRARACACSLCVCMCVSVWVGA